MSFGDLRANDDKLLIAHEELWHIVPASSVGTRLSARLTPDMMQADLYPKWAEPVPFREVFYTRDVANGLARAIGSFVALGLTLAVAVYVGLSATGPADSAGIALRWPVLVVLLFTVCAFGVTAWAWIAKSTSAQCGSRWLRRLR